MKCLTFSIIASFFFFTSSAFAKPVDSIGNCSKKPFAMVFNVASNQNYIDQKRIELLLHNANRLFADAGIVFDAVEIKLIPSSFSVLETVLERHKLKKFFLAKTINVFLVDEIVDSNSFSRKKKTSAWMSDHSNGVLPETRVIARGKTPNSYLVLSKNASSMSLTNELGRFFGTSHGFAGSAKSTYKQRFDKDQIETIRSFAKRYLRRKVVRTVPDYINEEMSRLVRQ